MDQKSFAAELPTTEETREEHDGSLRQSEAGRQYPEDKKYKYNPQDYANTQNPPPMNAHPAYYQQQYAQHPQHAQQYPPQYTAYGPPSQR